MSTIIVAGFLLRACDLSRHRFLAQQWVSFYCQVWVSSCGVGPKPSQEVVCDSYAVHATITLGDMPCQASHYYSSQGSHLGKTE